MPDDLAKKYDPNCLPTDDGIFGLPASPEDAAIVLLPVPWEVTASYRKGTSRAPQAIHAASFQVELFDNELGSPYEHGIAMLIEDNHLQQMNKSAIHLAKLGDAEGVDHLCREMNESVQQQVKHWRQRGKLVGVIGGEHSVCLGAIKATAEEVGQLSVLQIDAHADLRESYEGYQYSHACTASNLLKHVPQLDRLLQVGVRDICPAEAKRIEDESRVTTFFDNDLARIELIRNGCETIISPLGQKVWITVDIDGLDPSLCPSTGTPVPGGLSWREITALLTALAASGRQIVGFDLCEVVPGNNNGSQGDFWDAIVAARLLYKLCAV